MIPRQIEGLTSMTYSSMYVSVCLVGDMEKCGERAMVM
jgi:hypothetical protein